MSCHLPLNPDYQPTPEPRKGFLRTPRFHQFPIENGGVTSKVAGRVRQCMKPDFAFVLDQAGWPAFLVDDSATIRRANAAAVAVFGPVMEGEPSLSASIWSPTNPLGAEEFVKLTERSSSPVAQLQFRIKGGTSMPYHTTVCPFVRGERRYLLFQLAVEAITQPQSQPQSQPQPQPQPQTQTRSAKTTPETPAQDSPATVDASLAQRQKLECAMQLIRTVALDFNNALTTILGHTSLVLSRLEPGHPWRKSLMQVERSAERAAEIAQDLADFSRQEKDARTQTPGNLNTVIRHAVELFQGPGHANILWAMQLEKRLFTVSFDEAKMQQAFARVLENSVEAVGPEGRIVVRTLNHTFAEPVTSPAVRLAAGHYVCVEITDNGTGIPLEAQARVFESFFTTKTDPRHRGLGLAWVYGIVTNHGGVVAINSQPGQGTTVRIFLPAQQKIVRDLSTRVEDLRGHETVLFVDDEEMLLNLGQTVLSAFGYKVLTPNNCQRALELFRNASSRIHLVVTDMVMPGMSGRELVDQLRRLAPTVPILCTSGYVRPTGESEEESYLRKPFTSQELLRRVRRLLNAREAM